MKPVFLSSTKVGDADPWNDTKRGKKREGKYLQSRLATAFTTAKGRATASLLTRKHLIY